MPPASISDMREDFVKEYSVEKNMRRYMKKTAGYGISYLLKNDYGNVYFEVIDNFLPKVNERGLRILEFGCGAGMNLIHLVSALEQRGTRVDFACGTDFSTALIASANAEAKEAFPARGAERVQFCAAKNDTLLEEMCRELHCSPQTLTGSFDLILGVNTVRYCHRLKNEMENALQIRELLRDGGVFIVIDMNNKFPVFRSRFRDRATKDKEAYYLPSLAEYGRPFERAKFEILRKDNFCWIPHSAGPSLTTIMKTMTPIFNAVMPSRAMRSLVIGRKNDGYMQT